LLYDLLCKEPEGKYDIEDITKKWKELVMKFKNGGWNIRDLQAIVTIL